MKVPPFSIPIIILAFDRPETTYEVLKKVHEINPDRLYFACDGPRIGKPADVENIRIVRALIEEFKWQNPPVCLFSDENKGCRKAVSEAITSFFEKEEMGIILEDDCIPSTGFFEFCRDMLVKYKLDSRIWMISGFNPRYPAAASDEIYFSDNPSCWGWATWSDRWENLDLNMKDSESEVFKAYLRAKFPLHINLYYQRLIRGVKSENINSWAVSWTYTILVNHGLVVKLKANLIKNIGHVGTHSVVKTKNHDIPTGRYVRNELRKPLLLPNMDEDNWYYSTRINAWEVFRNPFLLFTKIVIKKILPNFVLLWLKKVRNENLY